MQDVTETGRSTPERSAHPATGVALGLVRAMRPRQWVKNLLVFAAPIAAGGIFEREHLVAGSIAFGAFTLAAIGTYLVNDVRDVKADRRHREKRRRPIAAGIVPLPLARVVAVTCLFAGLGLPIAAGRMPLAGVIAVYVATTTMYSYGLKEQPLFELVIVAAGFVLRAMAGAVAADVPISQWFLIVTSFGSLYLVASKRYAEMRDHVGVSTRAVLRRYTNDVLREIRFTSAAVTIVGYVLWAFENAGAEGTGWWFQISIVPFVLAIYRYAMAVHGGEGEAPEEILLKDRQIVALGTAWAILYGVGLYVG